MIAHANAYDAIDGEHAVRAGCLVIAPSVHQAMLSWPQPYAHYITSVFLTGYPGRTPYGCSAFFATGTIPLHTDMVIPNRPVSLGLILVNDIEARLRRRGDRNPLLRLCPGSVFRLNPNRQHGTLLGDRATRPDGAFAFVSADFEAGSEPDPVTFARTVAAVLPFILPLAEPEIDEPSAFKQASIAV
jgi:hypothetical protein